MDGLISGGGGLKPGGFKVGFYGYAKGAVKIISLYRDTVISKMPM